jgi:hypothetical protein
MNPYLQHHLADDRVADMHSHAERQRIARAARRARRAAQRPGAQPVAGPGSMFTPLRTQPFSTT